MAFARRGGFRRGYLFPELSGKAGIEKARTNRLLLLPHIEKETKGLGWAFKESALQYYSPARRPESGFEEHLRREIEKSERDGRKLHVLEIGVGTGRQWAEFLKKHGNDFKFHATALTREFLHPSFTALVPKERITLVNAASIYKKFKPGYFDLVLSHMGTHYQEKEALEAILHVLKPGGEAMVTVSEFAKIPVQTGEHAKHYETLDVLPSETGYFYHIRKKAQK